MSIQSHNETQNVSRDFPGTNFSISLSLIIFILPASQPIFQAVSPFFLGKVEAIPNLQGVLQVTDRFPIKGEIFLLTNFKFENSHVLNVVSPSFFGETIFSYATRRVWYSIYAKSIKFCGTTRSLKKGCEFRS